MNRKRPIRRMGSLVNQLLAQRGYGQRLAADQLHSLVSAAVAPHLRPALQVGHLRGGILYLYAQDSVTLQQLTFEKRAILRHLQAELPDSRIKDLRLRLQS